MSEYTQLQQSLASGWNTWHTRSVMAHVLLPRGLSVQIGIKEYREGRYLREALIGRQGAGQETVRPGIRSYDGTYTELTVTWQDIELRVESAADGDDWVLLATPLRNQPVPAVLVAECGVLWNREGFVRLSPERDAAEAVFPDRTIGVYPSGSLVEEYHVSAAGPYLAQRLTGAVGLSAGKRRTLAEIKDIVAHARSKLEARTAEYREAGELWTAMQTCLAWDTVYDPKFGRVITPVSRIWNDQGYKLFCWDTYFAAYMCMEDNRPLAYANAVEITRSAVEAGFVPNYDWSGVNVSRDRSQPPVGSFVVLQLYRKHGDRWLLEEVFEQLWKWNAWWPEHRQIEDGLLAWGSDPMEPLTGNEWETAGVNDTFGAALESGLDNSPLYDGIPFNREKNALELADAGLMGLYVMDCLALAEIADILGKTERSAVLRALANRFGAGLQRLWDEETGIFRNLRTDTGAFSGRLAPTNFYPMLTPYVTRRQVRRMVEEHLYNPDEFWGDWVLPSISRNDPAYPDQDYWRGRIWAPMNLLVYLGLRKQGETEAARLVAEKSAALILKEWREHGHVHENYNGGTGEGCDVPNSDRYYHWGGLLAFIALMERGFAAAP
ncbi:MGH1-like glycoside hydrolase domain-containing protein [Cohnella caldifontis]|uniref:MGH1-like glycoside hydrolase domain-containing protein n=1 Tax=Cohnella caldifontis TaxID=3027471 RepID=UPI0023EB9312|nr:trehalase family glycosidase [Cohnella sp. YIM B05605]